MITENLSNLKFNIMSNEKFDEKQENNLLQENEIYLTPAPQIDNEPIENSKNLITSGGVFEALQTAGGGVSEWEDIQNKPGDTITTTAEKDILNIENAQFQYDEERYNIYYAMGEYPSDEIRNNRSDIIGKEVKISICSTSDSEPTIYTEEAFALQEGQSDAVVYLNTIHNFNEALSNGIPKNDPTMPAFMIVFASAVAAYSPEDCTGYDIKVFIEEITTNTIKLPNEALTFDNEPTKDSENLVTSGTVWTALGERSSIYIDDENLPQSGSQSLMTSNAIYNAFEQMNQNKQDTLTILDTVQENSDGIVKSSGIYNAIEEVKNDIPTTTSQLTNNSNFIDQNQLNSAVQEVMNVANGKRDSYVVKDEAELNAFIASNRDDLKIGDIFLLTDTGFPDYWWTGSNIAILETDIDLDNYYNQSQVDDLLSQNHYSKTEIDSQFDQRLEDLMFRKAYSSQISNPVEGTIYYNISDKTIQTYSGGSWSSAVSADPNTIYFVVEG